MVCQALKSKPEKCGANLWQDTSSTLAQCPVFHMHCTPTILRFLMPSHHNTPHVLPPGTYTIMPESPVSETEKLIQYKRNREKTRYPTPPSVIKAMICSKYQNQGFRKIKQRTHSRIIGNKIRERGNCTDYKWSFYYGANLQPYDTQRISLMSRLNSPAHTFL